MRASLVFDGGPLARRGREGGREGGRERGRAQAYFEVTEVGQNVFPGAVGGQEADLAGETLWEGGEREGWTEGGVGELDEWQVMRMQGASTLPFPSSFLPSLSPSLTLLRKRRLSLNSSSGCIPRAFCITLFLPMKKLRKGRAGEKRGKGKWNDSERLSSNPFLSRREAGGERDTGKRKWKVEWKRGGRTGYPATQSAHP